MGCCFSPSATSRVSSSTLGRGSLSDCRVIRFVECWHPSRCCACAVPLWNFLPSLRALGYLRISTIAPKAVTTMSSRTCAAICGDHRRRERIGELRLGFRRPRPPLNLRTRRAHSPRGAEAMRRRARELTPAWSMFRLSCGPSFPGSVGTCGAVDVLGNTPAWGGGWFLGTPPRIGLDVGVICGPIHGSVRFRRACSRVAGKAHQSAFGVAFWNPVWARSYGATKYALFGRPSARSIRRRVG